MMINYKKQITDLITYSRTNRDEYLNCIYHPNNEKCDDLDFSKKIRELKQYYKKIIIPKYKYEKINNKDDLILLIPKKYEELNKSDIELIEQDIKSIQIQSGGNKKQIKNFKYII